jgi:hypothetical protein
MGSFSRVPGVEEVEPKNFLEHNPKRVKIRYGPYNIPSVNSGFMGKLLEGGTGGMIWNLPHRSVKKPCTDCVITYMRAGLEDVRGETVNANNGLYLHHMVAINSNGRSDATCGSNPASLPHIDVGTTAATAERFFSSGNERTRVDIGMFPSFKAGYYVKPNDNFNLIVDLMNENPKEEKVYMTITYEYITGKPEGFSDLRPVWFDADQCGVSDVKPKSQNGAYTIAARPWRANFDGKIIALGSHLHDGGINAVVTRDGEVVCNSEAKYAETSAYVSQMKGRNRMTVTEQMGSMEHISSLSLCGTKDGVDIGDIKKGQTWVIKGNYDYSVHAGMKNGRGKQSDVMAIAIMYVAVPMR